MDPIGIAGLAVAIVGTVLAAAVAVRGKQLSSSRIDVTVGPRLPAPEVSWKIRRLPLGALVTGTVDRPDVRPFTFPLIVENKSSVPIAELVLRLEYPSSCLMEKAVFVDREKMHAHLPPKATRDREVIEMAGVAYVSINLGLLRPGEVMATGELVALRARLNHAEPPSSAFYEDLQRAKNRYGDVEGFVAAIPVNVHVRAANLKPSTFTFAILWIHGATRQAVLKATRRVSFAAWNGRWPQAGRYLRPILPKRWRRDVKVTILHQETPSLTFPIDPSKCFEESMLGGIGALSVPLPLWGFFGDDSDISPAVGVRLG